MVKRQLFLFTCLLLGISLQAQVTKNLYLIGNSVTDAINYGGLDALAESKGNTHNWGRHMIPGAPLQWIWDHPNDGISEPPYGLYPNALPNYTWDAISLQPFDRGLDGPDGDVTMGANYINLAKGKSPNMQVYVYSRWPRKQSTFPETADAWNQLWTRTYGSSGPNTEETADYFVKLTNRLRTNHTDIKPVLMVPVGQVFQALNNKMKAGQVPGYTSIWQVYSDGIHMTGTGSYIASVTYYATLYGQDPRGLSVPSQYGTIGPDVARIIQETAWSVVTTEPLSGVTGGTTPPPTTLKAAETPSGTVAGVNYSYYEGTWSTLPAFGSLTAVKTGNVANFDMSVRNRVDNYAFQYTGYVQVPADGQYTFYTSSDDGSKLYIGTTEVVNNDGLHAMQERSGTIGLRAGKHSVTVTFFEATGGEGLTVSYSSPALAKTTIPAGALSSLPPAAANRAPTAVLNATSTSGTAPLTVSFSATGSSDPDAGDFILGYEWDFGDGTPFNNSNAPSHTYNTPGTYTARLRVMDNRNLYSAPVSRTITVSGTTTGSFSGTYKITARHSAKALDVNGNGTTDGTNVQQWTDNGSTAQQWIITATTDGFYRIVGKGSGKALEVSNSSLADGGNAQIWSYTGANTQQWKIEATTDGFYRILNRNSGKALDVNGGATTDGANVHQWTYNGGGNQQWQLTQLSTATARQSFEDSETAGAALTLFPNPAHNRLTVQFTAEKAGPVTVDLLDGLSRNVLTVDKTATRGINAVSLDVSRLPRGLYLVKVSRDGKPLVRKVLVE